MTQDHELLERWGNGDRGAGAVFVDRYFVSVRRFFINKVGPAAEDLVQETFARCLESRSRCTQTATLQAYLFGIARFVLFEHFRSKSKRNDVDFGVTSIAAIDPSPSQMVAESDQRMAVLAALRCIPLEQQVALELFYWENLSVRQLSSVLEVPEGTVKSRLHHGRRALRERMGHDDAAAILGGSKPDELL